MEKPVGKFRQPKVSDFVKRVNRRILERKGSTIWKKHLFPDVLLYVTEDAFRGPEEIMVFVRLKSSEYTRHVAFVGRGTRDKFKESASYTLKDWLLGTPEWETILQDIMNFQAIREVMQS